MRKLERGIEMVKIRVPGTSANIGVGFDCLGLALNIYADFYFEPSPKLVITGSSNEEQNENNLVYRAFKRGLKELGKPIEGIKIHIDSDIPSARGLGSSAACIVAGIMGAYAMTKTPLNKKVILNLAAEIEGHTDNVAPAILGGLIASYKEDTDIYLMDYKVNQQFKFLAIIPDFLLDTHKSRQLLPEHIEFKKATSNIAKLALALKALETFDEKTLKIALTDELHEPYRKELIEGYDEIKAISNAHESLGFYVSGSGPTLINIIKTPQIAMHIQKSLDKKGLNWHCKLLDIEQRGANICWTNIT